MLTVLDEAYFEYVEDPDYPDGIEEYLKAGRRVLVLRTFSKIYGLAGLRVGYGVGPAEVVDRDPQGPERLRRDADRPRTRRWRAWATRRRSSGAAASNAAGRATLEHGLRELGVPVAARPVGNFVFAEVGGDARPLFEALLREGVIVRPLAGFGAPEAIRVTVGTAEENELFSTPWSACSRSRGGPAPPTRAGSMARAARSRRARRRRARG